MRDPYSAVSKKLCVGRFSEYDLPSGPHGVNVHTLGDVNNQLDVGVVVVVRSAGYLVLDLERVWQKWRV